MFVQFRDGANDSKIVNVDDITFGSGIGAATLIGRTRQQQFFYAGF